VIEARRYMRVKALVESATTAGAVERLPDSPAIRLAQEIDFELAREAIDQESQA
jgi:hypothetical protein